MIKWKRFALHRYRQIIACALAGAVLIGPALLGSAGAKTYTITDGHRVVTYTTFATDPAQILGEAGLSLDREDSCQTQGQDIQVNRAQQVHVERYGERHTLTTPGETVLSLLTRAGLEPEPGDRLSHCPESPTWDGMQIRIDRVAEREETSTRTLPHETLYCEDPTLAEGVSRVLVGGRDGELQQTARVTYTNARETGRQVLSETMTQAPVTQIVAVGTGREEPPEEGLVIGDGYILLPTGERLTYRDTAAVRATAYTHTDEGCDRITYTGTTVRVGTVAVDPRFIPYGTRMFIVSDDGEYIYGLSVAEDCGGAIKRDRIDLYFPTYQECIQFGRRNCTIYFLG